jgi:hypothetical protein
VIQRSGTAQPFVAALFVQTGGVYFELDGVDPWDERRDARLYDGPWPVVAHPPCARWCRFAPGIEKQYGYKVGDDDGCFEAALNSVRTFGGVLEHPAYSKAWDRFGLPKPTVGDGWTYDLLDEGASCYVEQGRYGLSVKKATWLYAVGVDLPELRWGKTSDAEAGAVRWARIRYKGDELRERVKASETAKTPPEFRDVLLSMARMATKLDRAAGGDRDAEMSRSRPVEVTA